MRLDALSAVLHLDDEYNVQYDDDCRSDNHDNFDNHDNSRSDRPMLLLEWNRLLLRKRKNSVGMLRSRGGNSDDSIPRQRILMVKQHESLRLGV